MKLQHQTQVGATPDDVWAFLQNTRAVVRCLPGAELVDELEDDRYEGVLRVSIGPLKMNYAGAVSVVERDAHERRIVLNATGRDKRGSGGVQAHVEMQVFLADNGSRLDVVSDLDLSGRIASLGRGVRDVSNRMFTDFAGNLGASVENPTAPDGRTTVPNTPPTVTTQPTHPIAAQTGATGPGQSAPVVTPGAAGEIKVLPFVWNITRERLADFLNRLSARVRPR